MSNGFLGLGYKHNKSSTITTTTTTTKTANNKNNESTNKGRATNTTVGITDALMEQYFQQCMDYHEEQVIEEKLVDQSQPTKSSIAEGGIASASYSTRTANAAPTFVAANVLPGSDTPGIEQQDHSNTIISTSIINGANHENNNTSQQSTHDTTTISTSKSLPTPIGSTSVIPTETKPQVLVDINSIEFQQRIENAKLIAKRFASQSSTVHTILPTPPNNNNNNNISTSTPNNKPSTPYYPYAQKRQEFLNEIHSKRLQSSYMKNLNYLLKKDETTHQVQVQHLQYHSEMQHRLTTINTNAMSSSTTTTTTSPFSNFNMLSQSNGKAQSNVVKNVTTMAGIGSKERTKVERSKEQKGHVPTIRQCGVYVTGLPNHTKKKGGGGTTTVVVTAYNPQNEEKASEELEGLLRQLFSSFGKVTRVTLYRDKKTNRRKGDAIILYEWKQAIRTTTSTTTTTTTSSEGQKSDGGMVTKVTTRSSPEDFLMDICNQVRSCFLLY